MSLPRKKRTGRKAKSLQKEAQALKERRDREKGEIKKVALVTIAITAFFLIWTLWLILKNLRDLGCIHIPINLLLLDFMLISLLSWVIYDWAKK